MFIVYKLDTYSRGLNKDFTIDDYLFVAVNLTKNADTNKFGYSRYGTEFDARSQFSLSNGK